MKLSLNTCCFYFGLFPALVLTACVPVTPATVSLTSSITNQPEANGTPTPISTTLPNPEPMRAVKAHPAGSFVHLSWSPDGRLLASGGNDDKVMVWDVETLEPIHTFTHPDMALSHFTSFSPDGRWLMVSEGRHIEMSDGGYDVADVIVWDLQKDTRLTLLTDSYQVLLAAWNAEGNLLAYLDTTHEPTIRFWAVPGTGVVAPEPITILPFDIGDMRWLPDGTLIVAGVIDKGFVLWRSTSPGALAVSTESSFVGVIFAYSPDGSLAGSLEEIPVTSPDTESGLGIFVWDTTTGDLRDTFRYQDFYGLSGMAFSPDNALLATGREKEVRVWDLASGGVAAILTGQASLTNNLAFSPDGKTLAASEENGEIRLWRLDAYLGPPKTPTPIPTPTAVPVSDVMPVFLTSFSVPGVNPDEPAQLSRLRWLDQNTLHLITAPTYLNETTGQQRITEYDLILGREIDSSLVEISAEKYFDVIFYPSPIYSPDGGLFASWLRNDIGDQEDDTVGVYDTATNDLLLEIPPGQISVGNGIAWAPDGSRIAIQTFPAIEVFAVPTGEHVMTLENVLLDGERAQYENVIWAPNGAWIASYWQGPVIGDRVAIWESETGALVYEYDSGRYLAFSPDGGSLLVVRSDGADLLNLAGGELASLHPPGEQSNLLWKGVWSSEGTYVALEYQKGYWGAAYVLIWNTQTGSQTTLLQRQVDPGYGMTGDLVWSPAQPQVATLEGGVVYILDAVKQDIIRLDPAVTQVPEELVWSPNGTRLAIVGADGIVEIWEFSG